MILKSLINIIHLSILKRLTISNSNWEENNNGLFDYTNSNFYKHIHNGIKNTCVILKNKYSLVIVDDFIKQFNNNKDKLLDIKFENGYFCIYPLFINLEDIANIDNKALWKISKYNKENTIIGIKLKTNDIIKMGKAIIKISLIKYKFDDDNLNFNEFIKVKKKSIIENIEDQNQCRICLQEHEIDNPLTSPCNCSGTSKYIHIQCLKKWFITKNVYKMTQYSISINFKKFKCELCNGSIDKGILFNSDGNSDLINLENIEPPFMIFEVLNKKNGETKSLNLLKLNYKKNIKFGRQIKNDIRLYDLSISRFHSTIQLNKDGVYIIDRESKFGTWVLETEKIVLNKSNNNLIFQLGKSVLNFEVSAKWKYYKNDFKDKDTYNNKSIPNNNLNFFVL